MSVSRTIESLAQVESVIREAFNFTVDKVRLRGVEGELTPHYGLRRSDNAYYVPVAVKSGFNPHTVDDIVACAKAGVLTFKSGIVGSTVTATWGTKGHRVIIAPSKEYRRSIFGTKDNLFPRLLIEGNYGSTFNFESGLYRDVCRNLMIARSVQSIASIRFRHTHSLTTRIDEMVSAMSVTAQNFESAADVAESLAARKTSVADFLATLYPVADDSSGKALTQAKNRTEKIINRILNERALVGNTSTDLSEGTLWELLNGITGYVQHDKTRHKIGGQSMGQVDRALSAVNDAESIAAWDLAVALAS